MAMTMVYRNPVSSNGRASGADITLLSACGRGRRSIPLRVTPKTLKLGAILLVISLSGGCYDWFVGVSIGGPAGYSPSGPHWKLAASPNVFIHYKNNVVIIIIIIKISRMHLKPLAHFITCMLMVNSSRYITATVQKIIKLTLFSFLTVNPFRRTLRDSKW